MTKLLFAVFALGAVSASGQSAFNGTWRANNQNLEYQGIEESGTALGIWRLRAKASVETAISGEVVTASLPVRDMPTRPELERQLKTATERYEIERLERALARRSLVGDGAMGDLPFTVWRLGDSFLVATPAEP